MPTSGALLCPVAWTALHKNSAVSRPSRPTARNAVSTSATPPSASAASRRPCSCALRWRAVRRIQKIIQVTKATATIDTSPAKASC